MSRCQSRCLPIRALSPVKLDPNGKSVLILWILFSSDNLASTFRMHQCRRPCVCRCVNSMTFLEATISNPGGMSKTQVKVDLFPVHKGVDLSISFITEQTLAISETDTGSTRLFHSRCCADGSPCFFVGSFDPMAASECCSVGAAGYWHMELAVSTDSADHF